MLPRDAEATRARLIAAATDEFARHGVAGARVERIAEQARSNKAQIYHYFGSKDGLFGAVLGAYVRRSVESEYFDASDLPGTAAALFDDFERHPELARLVSWYRLEATDAAMPELEAANRTKIEAIARAQADGVVTDRFPPVILLGLVLMIASSWSDLPAGFEAITLDHTAAERRDYVVEAVARLVAPDAGSGPATR